MTLNHTARLKKPLVINANMNIYNNCYNDSVSYSYLGAISTGYTFKNWSNALGFNTFITKSQEERIGFYYQSSIKFAKYFNFEIRVERNIYDNNLSNELSLDYKEILVKTNLNMRL